VVFVDGSVRRPGEYDLKNGMRLGDLLAPEEVLPEAYVDRIEVIRTRPDFTRQLLTSDLRRRCSSNPRVSAPARCSSR